MTRGQFKPIDVTKPLRDDPIDIDADVTNNEIQTLE
jgi:hypothetical protein